MAVAKKKSQRVAEFGDFQTPIELARRVAQHLASIGIAPNSVVEPTCGKGSLLFAAIDQFPNVESALGLDINLRYVESVMENLQSRRHAGSVRVLKQDFFDADWPTLLKGLPDPLLIIGNPPWVTNSELSSRGSSNVPTKTNFQNHNGLDAVTGKANFDISEWMLIRMLDWIRGRRATIAMLCKTAVARKVLLHAWKHGIGVAHAAMYRIDAKSQFGAAVDACLLVCSSASAGQERDCRVYDSLRGDAAPQIIGYRGGGLVADVRVYERWKHLDGVGDENYRWRSGIKHDCAKVMELVKVGNRYRNGLGELLDLGNEFLYPMLKSSEVAGGRTTKPTRWMLVPQRSVGEDTSMIRSRDPKTWRYLQSHADLLARRASSIYRKRPAFSIFGVGDYSFAPWKIAISGFYKSLDFVAIGSFAGKPIMLDDTSYFLPCQCREEAEFLASLLCSDPAQEFLSGRVFWDAKRPITVELLRRLNLDALARELGSECTLAEFNATADAAKTRRVLSLFR